MGEKFDYDPRFSGLDYNTAMKLMQKQKAAKVRKGYIDATGPNHVSPITGEKLKKGEYPIGLLRESPGFGWGTQAVTTCVPALNDLRDKIIEALDETKERDTEGLKDDLEAAMNLVSAVPDSTMAAKLRSYIRKPYGRLKGLPRFMPDPDGKVVTKELTTILRYLNKQMAYCD